MGPFPFAFGPFSFLRQFFLLNSYEKKGHLSLLFGLETFYKVPLNPIFFIWSPYNFFLAFGFPFPEFSHSQRAMIHPPHRIFQINGQWPALILAYHNRLMISFIFCAHCPFILQL